MESKRGKKARDKLGWKEKLGGGSKKARTGRRQTTLVVRKGRYQKHLNEQIVADRASHVTTGGDFIIKMGFKEKGIKAQARATDEWVF